MNTTSAVIVFAKDPQLGRVKTRVAAESTLEFAMSFYTACLDHLFDWLRQSSFQVLLFLAPPAEGSFFAKYGKLPVYVQEGVDLGRRMHDALQRAFINHDRAVIIGSDIPGITQTLLQKAFEALDTSDAVIGPCTDGGYYLIGFRKESFIDCFQDIKWSTDTVFFETMLRLQHNTVALLPRLDDMDTVEDIRRCATQGRLPPALLTLAQELVMENSTPKGFPGNVV